MRRGRFSRRREALVGLGVYALYLGVRALVYDDEGRARADRNAARLVRLERRLGVDVEPALQRRLLPRRRLVATLNVAYITLNVGLTVGWLAHLFRRRDPAFFCFRNAVALATAGAQPAFLGFPTAPPRKLDHLTDTIAEAGLDLDSGLVSMLYCPIAAMPSIHVAYAVVTASALRETSRSSALRLLAPAYPPAVALTVLATANHYVLDCVAGAFLGSSALWIARRTAP